MTPAVRDPLRRARHAAARADRVDAEGAGRDRRPADPLARDRDLRGAGVRALPALHRLPGRDDRGVRAAPEPGRRGSASKPSTPGSRRRPAAGSSWSPTGSEGGPSAPPTPTASPTSTSRALLDFHRDHGELATMTVVRPHLQWGVAELDGDGRVGGLRREAPQRALDQRRLLLLRAAGPGLPRRRQRPRARAAAAAGGRAAPVRLPPRGLLGLHGHLQGRGRPQRPLGGRRGSLGGRGTRMKRSLVTGATASSPRTWPAPCSSAATASPRSTCRPPA